MQNDLTFRYAGFWRRAAALIIDLTIMIIPSMIFGMAIPFVGGPILGLLFRPVFDASPIGASPGRALMGIKILSEQGTRLTLKQAYIRYFSFYLTLATLSLGFLMSLFNERRQTLHDMIAQTVVIQAPIPSVNFFALWTEEVSKLFSFISNSQDQTETSTQPKPQTPTQITMPSPSSATSETRGAQSARELEEQLVTLKKLVEQGLITTEDYEKKKLELLAKF